MNIEMAYLVGLILGNGELQQGVETTNITIDFPYKNLRTDDQKEVSVYVKASLLDIKGILDPLIGTNMTVTQSPRSTKISFKIPNHEYVTREILRFVGQGAHHSTMRMNPDLFNITTEEKKSLLRGIADSTGYIRRSNYYITRGVHRVYIEIPGNWFMVADIANMLRDVDIPVQTIDFGHPNFRDGNMKKYNAGKINFWKKEHQVKIYANEFLPVGFNISHKQAALETLSEELLKHEKPEKTHKFYWEKTSRPKNKPHHPGENDPSLPSYLRGRHFDSWQELAQYLGYGPKR